VVLSVLNVTRVAVFVSTVLRVRVVVTAVEIMAGSIMFDNNHDLCFVNTIKWSDVMTHRRSNISDISDNVSPSKCNCHLQCVVYYYIEIVWLLVIESCG